MLNNIAIGEAIALIGIPKAVIHVTQRNLDFKQVPMYKYKYKSLHTN